MLNLLGTDTWGVLKIMFLVGMVVYILFAVVVTRQITHMTKTLKFGLETPVQFLGILHLVASIGLLILAAIVL